MVETARLHASIHVRPENLALGERFIMREALDVGGALNEAVIIEWSPSKRFVKLLLDPSHKPHMKWFDLEKGPLICFEKLPELPRRKKEGGT